MDAKVKYSNFGLLYTIFIKIAKMRYMQISFNSRTIFSGYDCRKRCVGSADVSWPQSVGSGILKVHGTLVKYILNN